MRAERANLLAGKEEGSCPTRDVAGSATGWRRTRSGALSLCSGRWSRRPGSLEILGAPHRLVLRHLPGAGADRRAPRLLGADGATAAPCCSSALRPRLSCRSTGAPTSGRLTTATSSRPRSATTSTRSSRSSSASSCCASGSSPPQWVSVGLAAAAVAVLTVDYGTLPWIALVLAVSFATYGFIKNRLGAGAVDSLAVESALLTPLALVYLGWLEVSGRGDVRPPGLGPQPAARRDRAGHPGAAAVLRLRRHAAAAEHARAAAVPGADAAVRARDQLLRRVDVAGPLGRLRPRLAGPADHDDRRPAPGPAHRVQSRTAQAEPAAA